jgi:hypothetical protein
MLRKTKTENYDIYLKVKSVIESCDNPKQINVANNMRKLALKRQYITREQFWDLSHTINVAKHNLMPRKLKKSEKNV